MAERMEKSANASRYQCPACGFLIHNRGYPKCERCGGELPSHLLLSKEDRDADWKATMAARAEARKRERPERDVGGGADFGLM